MRRLARFARGGVVLAAIVSAVLAASAVPATARIVPDAPVPAIIPY